jgi:hypothetical protein
MIQNSDQELSSFFPDDEFMKKQPVLAVMFMLVCLSAHAEWKKVSETIRADRYVETSSVRTEGDYRRAKELFNLYEKHPDWGNLSFVIEQEYDCPGRRTRTVTETWWSEHFGKGKEMTPADLSVSPRWDHIGPSDWNSPVLEWVCSQ